jgi:hypothetical protein
VERRLALGKLSSNMTKQLIRLVVGVLPTVLTGRSDGRSLQAPGKEALSMSLRF